MTNLAPLRKVLIIEEDPAIRHALYTLLAGVGCDGATAYNGQHALSRISRESFDAVLLDLRCSNPSADEVVSKIGEIRPSLMGRILVITGEVSDPKTMELIELRCLTYVRRNRLMQDLWDRLRSLLNRRPATKLVPE